MAPEPEATTSATTTVQKKPAERQITVGVDPFRGGFNPHLVADDTATTQAIAALVFPSAFVDGKLNEDVLVDAQLVDVPGSVQAVRYRLQDAAQWSDGTPITGADFEYLWSELKDTPGVIDSAGYRAIQGVSTSEGGKTVTVTFNHRVADWQRLFANLLPSHLLKEQEFSRTLQNQIPAAANRYMVDTIDRGRGLVTLARNDRFWGPHPAQTEKLSFLAVANTLTGTEMLRTRQLNFLDLSPKQSSVAAYSLVPEVQTRTRNRSNELGITIGLTGEKRKAFASLVDPKAIAEIATARNEHLTVPPWQAPKLDHDVELGVVRIKADPADDVAATAATTLQDWLAHQGVKARVVGPSDASDVAIGWHRTGSDALTLATRYQAVPELKDTLSGYISGTVDEQAATAAVGNYLASSNTYIPLLADTRVEALAPGLVGPDANLDQWPVKPAGSMTDAATWRLAQ